MTTPFSTSSFGPVPFPVFERGQSQIPIGEGLQNLSKEATNLSFLREGSSRVRSLLICILLANCLFGISPAFSQVARPSSEAVDSPQQQPENVEQLIEEAQQLFRAQRPIDARAKLLKALASDPNDFRAPMMLGAYYLGEVGHFRLAYRYLSSAEALFHAKYGNDVSSFFMSDAWRHHARILLLMVEVQLNLDQYQSSLETLEKFAKFYNDPSIFATKAWILMKLGKMEEAIEAAQRGVVEGRSPGRTYNVLGILLSMSKQRELSLKAFAQSMRSEAAFGSLGQLATPLNNAGEVYREMFKDDFAEAAWLKAVSLPDGCEHVLPSLNTAILYLDALRLLQAERVLMDFERCFAADSVRSDTEHRALLALIRGRVQLRLGNIAAANILFTKANERRQWFGKIGTNQNDMRFAAATAAAQGLRAKAVTLKDKVHAAWHESVSTAAARVILNVRAWLLERQARNIALNELNNFEDLWIRHTDAMLEYPTLHSILDAFPTEALAVRLERLKARDDRPMAHAYYDMYLSANLIAHGRYDDAKDTLESLMTKWRTVDRLAKAESLALLIQATRSARSFWSSPSREEAEQDQEQRLRLYNLLPSHVRYHDFSLPVVFNIAVASPDHRELASEIVDALAETRFQPAADKLSARAFRCTIRIASQEAGRVQLNLELRTPEGTSILAAVDEIGEPSSFPTELVVNKFIQAAFTHRTDPPAIALPKLPELRGIM